MFRDDVNMDSRHEVLAYSAEMMAIANDPATADKDAYRGLADVLKIMAGHLPDDTPENSPQEADRALAAPETP